MVLTFLLQQQQAPPASPVGFPITFLLILVIFYFLLFLPMQRQRKRQRKMLSELQNGQTVLTNGGIVGTIVSMNAEDDTLILRVKPDNVKLQLSRSAVAGLIQPAEAKK
ncbi:MAG: preprotein translocase subunit YajC [Bryobacteraceae bacterium]